MNYKSNMAKSPNGATLGERITIRDGYGLHYKAGKKQDDLTVEQLVECVSGRKVKEIIYFPQSEHSLK